MRKHGISSALPLLAIISSLILGVGAGVVVTLATFGTDNTTTIIITSTTTESAGYLQPIENITLGATPMTTPVLITGDSFSPQEITVVIGVNNTVLWTNGDTDVHTATDSNGRFDSGMLNPGQTFQYTFNEPGTYDYDCSIHPWMVGVVIVESS